MRLGLITAAACALLPVAAHAELSEAAKLNGYKYAIRCFAASAFAKERGMASDNGAKAFGMAYDLGKALGYSNAYLASDVKARSKVEMQTMHDDAAYLDKAIGDCTKLKLL